MVVHAKLDYYKDTLNFILDTGSGGISLDSTTSAKLKVPTKLTDTSITGIGGKRKVEFAFGRTLVFPQLRVKDFNFHINNYEVLSSVYGENIDGIIGYSFFSRYIVKVNFDSLWIEVFDPGKMRYPKNGHLLHPLFTSLPILYLDIKDRKKISSYFYFDTGAGLCFLMSEQYAKDSSILLKKRKPVITQAEGMLGRLQMRQTVVREVKIGPYRFHDVPAFIYEDVYNVTSYPVAGGLIGSELLRRFNIILNYPKREIHLAPNGHYHDPFDYSYTGFALYYLDNKIIIGEVIDGSPAKKAGFEPGDEILSIDKNFSRNIQAYKNMLQVAAQKFQLIIMREGKVLQKVLVTGKIS
jgi:hypothetical protein